MEHKIDFVMKDREPVHEEEADYYCPNCNEKLTDAGKLFKCGCGFKMWKSVCGKDLTEQQIADFFETGSTGKIDGLTSKTGKTFSASVVLNEDKLGTSLNFD